MANRVTNVTPLRWGNIVILALKQIELISERNSVSAALNQMPCVTWVGRKASKEEWVPVETTRE